MHNILWTEDNRGLLKNFVEQANLTDKQIAEKMETTEATIEHARRRYGFRRPQYITAHLPTTVNLDGCEDAQFKDTIEKTRLHWKILGTKIPANKTGNFKSYIVVGDHHIPEHDVGAHTAIFKLMEDYKFDGIIELGDFLDLACVSHWNKGKHRTLEGKRLKQDYIMGNIILDEFDKRLPKGAEKHFFKGNHECLDDKTELLTRGGWINFNQLQDGDEVLVFNPITEKGEWAYPTNKVEYTVDGYLNRIKTNVIDLKATDDHKVFNYNRRLKKYEYTQVSNLTGSSYQIPVSCNPQKENPYNISDCMLQLVAWVLTDGHISNPYKYISIYQSKDSWKEIKNLLEKENLNYSFYERQRNINSIMCRLLKKKSLVSREFHLYAEDSNKIRFFLDRDKSLPSWITQLNQRQFDLFLSTLIQGDGSRHISAPETSLMLYGKKDFLTEIQIACIQYGYSASLSTYRANAYRLNINKRMLFNYESKTPIVKERYIGKVWDLTVPYHNFMIRRGGKCHFTGNCWVDQLIDELPALDGLFDIESALKLKERGYKIYNYNDIINFGKLKITHGMYAGANPAKTHVMKTLSNILVGHCHSPEMVLVHTPAKEVSVVGYVNGCLCGMSPEYMKNRPHNWAIGFAVLHLFPDGAFDVQLIRIVKNKFVYNGKVYAYNK